MRKRADGDDQIPDIIDGDGDSKNSGKVALGSEDRAPLPHGRRHDPEEGGMLMGPNHPIFSAPRTGRAKLPPGARHDPVSPARPFGEPDNDELMPPGPEGDDAAQLPRFTRNPGAGGPFFR